MLNVLKGASYCSFQRNSDKVRVLLLYPNITDYPIDISYGLASISAVLKSYNHQVQLVDFTFQKKKEVLVEILRQFNPDVIGMPVASNDFDFCVRIAGYIKKHSHKPIIAGGYHATLAPEDILAEDCFDVVVIGEGETPFIQILERLEGSRGKLPFKGIRGVFYKKSGRIIRNPLECLNQDPDSYPFPDKSLFDYQRYINLNRGLATFISSFGCPYSCTYCINKALMDKFGKQGFIRFKTVPYLVREIRAVMESYSIRELEFYDDTFTLDRQRLEEFSNIYPKQIGIPFSINSRVDTIREDEYIMLKNAGCKRISFGVECGDSEIRNGILKRNQSDNQIIKAFRLAREFGIETLSYNMVGIPHETKESIAKTIDLNRVCKPDYVAVSIFNAYKGTELHEQCKEKGWLRSDKGLSYFQTSNINHPNFSLKQLKRIRDRFGFEVFRKESYKRAIIDLIDKTLIKNRLYQGVRSNLIKHGIKNFLK